MINQTLAILLDAYRELNARKMFWISLVIALLVVSSFAILGIDEKGIQLFWWTFPLELINTTIISRKTFYVSLFVIIGLNLWLGWASTILGLVSTASIIPDFVASGSIECTLSKPVGRVRLFLTKYIAGLLFVILQALVFTLVSIIVIGFRSNEWLWGLLLGVPLVTLFFSYLYSISALIGVWTRSTLAALLGGLVLWGIILGVGIAETTVLGWRLNAEDPLPIMQADIAAMRTQIEQDKDADPALLKDLRARLEKKEADLQERQASATSAAKYHNYVWAAKCILPKTGETKELLSRVVANDEEIKRFVEANENRDRSGGGFQPANRRVRKKMEAVLEARSAWWVLSTSIAFEAVIVGAAAWIFARKDF